MAGPAMSGRAIVLSDDEWDVVVDTLVMLAKVQPLNNVHIQSIIWRQIADKIEHQHDRQRQMFADPALDGPQAVV